MSNEENIYARLITGDLTEKEIQDLKETGEWDTLQAILKTSSEWELPALDKEKGKQKIYASLNKADTEAVVKRNYFGLFSAVAAGITLMIGSYFFLMNQETCLYTTAAISMEHVFDDQSSVRLNATSDICFKKYRWTKDRRVYLNGEAYFSIKKGTPFIVETDLGEVRVLGTKFNVKTHNELFKIICFEGKVEVIHKGQKKILEKNDAAYFDLNGKYSKPEITNNAAEWLNGSSRFRGEKLSYVLQELERQYGIVVKSNVGDPIFSGAFQHGNLKTAANQITKPLGLKFKISDDEKSIFFSK